MMKESKALLVFETSADNITEGSVFQIIARDARQQLFTALCADHAERLSAGNAATVEVWRLPHDARTTLEGDDMFDGQLHGISQRIQTGSHPGSALADAFATLFDEGYRSVLVVLSHVVGSLLHHAREGFALLDTFDDGVVVGAVNDGSVGVVGLRHHARDVLEILRTADPLASDTLLRMLPSADCIIVPLATLRNPLTPSDLLHMVDSPEEELHSSHPQRFLTQLRHLHQRELLPA